jgi:hypothetical protein
MPDHFKPHVSRKTRQPGRAAQKQTSPENSKASADVENNAPEGKLLKLYGLKFN